jgi:hypothetical protein
MGPCCPLRHVVKPAVQPPFLSPLRNIEFSAISETWDWGYLVAQAEPFRLRLGGL